MEVSPGCKSTIVKSFLDTTRGDQDSQVRLEMGLGSPEPKEMEIAERTSPLEVSIIDKETQNSTTKTESVIATPVPGLPSRWGYVDVTFCEEQPESQRQHEQEPAGLQEERGRDERRNETATIRLQDDDDTAGDEENHSLISGFPPPHWPGPTSP